MWNTEIFWPNNPPQSHQSFYIAQARLRLNWLTISLLIQLQLTRSVLKTEPLSCADPQSGVPGAGKTRRWGRACRRHRAVTSHMQQASSQDSAEDLVSTTPAQEQNGQTDMQEGQWQQNQGAPVTIPCLCYLPPLSQSLLQVGDLRLAAVELHLQLLTCLRQ